ncbi:MAG: trypsin-like serine protease [Pseudomonadota bacterium]
MPPTYAAACARWSTRLGEPGADRAVDLCYERTDRGLLAREGVSPTRADLTLMCSATRFAGAFEGEPVVAASLEPTDKLTAAVVSQRKEGCWPEVAWLPDVACSAVLVAPLVLVTARHCVEASRAEFSMLREDGLQATFETPVLWGVPHPRLDLALLLLRDDPGLAPADWLDAVGADWTDAPLVGVGFGLQGVGETTLGKRGTTVQRRVDAQPDATSGPPAGSAPCGYEGDREPTCQPAFELVTASGFEGQPLDSAPGDSGGALYALVPAGPFQYRWLLVGVTSRGRSDRGVRFGEGGVHVRPDAVAPWMLHTIDDLHRAWLREER